MIEIHSTTPDLLPPPGPGGFAWRYLDLVDAAGDGIVLIWGFALPFLSPPEQDPARLHPHLNLAVYRGGRQVLYHLEAIDPSRVEQVPGGWRFDRSILRSMPTASGFRVEAELDLPIAGAVGRVEANIVAEGPQVTGVPAASGPHRWSPLCMPARGEATVMAAGRVVWSGAGRAYHDQNVSDVPVMQLQIQEWSWGRLAAPQAEVVHYVCHGVSPAATTAGAGTTSAPRWERLLQIDESGRVEIEEDPGFVEAGWGGGRWGLAAPATLGCTRGRLLGVPGASVQIGPVLDESPFYLRYPLTVPALGGVGAPLRGYGERFRPGSLQPWWAQAMVKMCVTQDRAPSGLLPWFSGPHDDRAQRLWSWWWS